MHWLKRSICIRLMILDMMLGFEEPDHVWISGDGDKYP